jgi:hypothetical protein
VERVTEPRQHDLPNGGELQATFAVADYLQLAGVARRSVTLTIYDGPRLLGRIDVQEGTPRGAEDALGSGESAFRRLALLDRVHVYCLALEAAVTSPNLSGSLEYLLMSAAREADELARKKPSAPPRPSSRTSSNSVVRVMPRAEQRQSLEPAREVNRSSRTSASLEQVLSRDTSLRGALSVTETGTLLETRGELDAEPTAAVAVLALRAAEELAAELGLGRPRAIQASRGALSLYVVRGPAHVVVSVGRANKNAVSLLKLLRGSAL